MQFVPFEEGIEVNGQTVLAVVDGLSTFSALASAYLLDEGIGRVDADGLVVVEPQGWYPQRAWLRSFQRISQQLGDSVLQQIGMAIPRNAAFPPQVRDIHGAIRSIDVAYHMNHRKQGRPMFDPETGRMEEGIGHYGCEPVVGQRRIFSVCHTPYPCAFDLGILLSMAWRFEPGARVVHDVSRPCRKREGDTCTYVITW
ncbi:MAG TPA: hypothetical protein VLQ93_07560 [Myxococcaceae bacterium]|nr:hypothetical protein [Myxococcaceae bacterium]